MKNGYSPITNNLTVPPVGGSSATQPPLYTTGYDNVIKTIPITVRVEYVDDTCISFDGKEYVVDWNKFIKDYCTEV